MARGKVYLVGAGPGDPELMTIKARRLLSEADVILYDRLLSMEMLKGLEGKEMIDVGKNAGRHKLTQDQINALLVQKGLEGNIVVRLKGGDPYLFGRGGEEALALIENGVDVEVVPGVTSAIAAPELAGIPVTHRGITSSLTIVTGHEEPGKDSPLDWSVLGKLGGTLVVLMGVSRLQRNVDALIEGGRSKETPAALVEKGGWPEQRLITGTLGDIVQGAKEAEVESPAVLVVGDVVSLSRRLARKRLAVFRPDAQIDEAEDLARRSGFEPVSAPAIALAERKLPNDILDRVKDAGCVVFTSANGVSLALKNGGLKEGLEGKVVVAIGPKTMRALEAEGISAGVPEEYSSEGLLKMLRGREGRILFLRSAQGSRYLSDDLRASGIDVDDVPLYDVVGSGDARLDDMIKAAGRIDAFAFTSSSTVRFLMQRACEMGLEESLRRALSRGRVGAIGKPTKEELERQGIRVDVMPEEFTFEALVEAMGREFTGMSS